RCLRRHVGIGADQAAKYDVRARIDFAAVPDYIGLYPYPADGAIRAVVMLRVGRDSEVFGSQETAKGEGLGFGIDKGGRPTGGGGGSGSRVASDVLDIKLL